MSYLSSVWRKASLTFRWCLPCTGNPSGRRWRSKDRVCSRSRFRQEWLNQRLVPGTTRAAEGSASWRPCTRSSVRMSGPVRRDQLSSVEYTPALMEKSDCCLETAIQCGWVGFIRTVIALISWVSRAAILDHLWHHVICRSIFQASKEEFRVSLALSYLRIEVAFSLTVFA